MLDDQSVIKQRDPQDYLGFVAQQPAQLTCNFGIADKSFPRPVKNVVFAGMGGSSLVAELIPTWPRPPVPFVINKEYRLPEFANEDTLVIASSYSGNTEETLTDLDLARQKGAQIAIATHGGKLADIAKEHGDVYAAIPHCPQPRAGVFYMYRAVVEIFVAAKLVPASAIAELEATVPHLDGLIKKLVAHVPQSENLAKQLAHRMAGKTPIIYAGPLMYPAAYKWKIDVNENAKNTAWCNALPEFNHNELTGWGSHPIEKPFAVIDLISSFEHPRVLQRFEITDRILSGMRPKAIRVEAQGANILEHLLYLILVGDYATTYLGILNGVNPTPVELVEKLKKELG